MSAAAPKPVEDPDLGTLPAWKLEDLYPGIDSPQITADLKSARRQAADFRRKFQGRLAKLGGKKLAAAIAAYEAVDEILSRILSYAQLVYAGDMSDPEIGRFYQSMQEAATDISAEMLFFTLELNQLEDADLARKLSDPGLARYGPWIRDQRAGKPYQLSEELERLLHEKHVSGRGAWNRLFNETMASLRFPFRDEALGSAEILNRMTDPDPAAREEAARSLGKVLTENQRLFAQITNTLAKDKAIEDDWRGYARPVSQRNLANLVEDEVVAALITSVRESYENLAHRYYRLKAKWFGVEALPFWDRNAPLPDAARENIPWPEARRQVLDAYAAFSPELAAIGRRFFEEDWIDVPVRPGKSPGAFAHPTVPSSHPFLLLNYQGRLRDVMTLAHELGHGVHQVLAGGQGHLMAQTPLTLAETASVFGEMLTFQGLLAAESDPARRRVMLAGKVEDMLNTVVRQVAMHCFEERLHDERRDGELLPDRISEIWLETQRDSLGPAVELTSPYESYWAYIPHFIHVPFYVYAYAFGDCLVNSLYAVYEEAEGDFAERYLALLRAGGTKRHRELLAPFGLDAADPTFWTRGLSLVSRFIDQLEAME